MKKYFVKLMSQLLYSMIHQVIHHISGYSSWIYFPFYGFFFSKQLCFLWSPCLLLIAESISLDSGKPSVGFFFENYFSLLNNIVNVTWWTWRDDDEFSWNNFYFIVVKEFWCGKNIRGFLENFFEYYFLNIIVNVNFFSDLKFEYYYEYYHEILLKVSLK